MPGSDSGRDSGAADVASKHRDRMQSAPVREALQKMDPRPAAGKRSLEQTPQAAGWRASADSAAGPLCADFAAGPGPSSLDRRTARERAAALPASAQHAAAPRDSTTLPTPAMVASTLATSAVSTVQRLSINLAAALDIPALMAASNEQQPNESISSGTSESGSSSKSDSESESKDVSKESDSRGVSKNSGSGSESKVVSKESGSKDGSKHATSGSAELAGGTEVVTIMIPDIQPRQSVESRGSLTPGTPNPLSPPTPGPDERLSFLYPAAKAEAHGDPSAAAEAEADSGTVEAGACAAAEVKAGGDDGSKIDGEAGADKSSVNPELEMDGSNAGPTAAAEKTTQGAQRVSAGGVEWA